MKPSKKSSIATERALTIIELKKLKGISSTLPEQTKISDCLSSLDDLITAHTQKLKALELHKKGLYSVTCLFEVQHSLLYST